MPSCTRRIYTYIYTHRDTHAETAHVRTTTPPLGRAFPSRLREQSFSLSCLASTSRITDASTHMCVCGSGGAEGEAAKPETALRERENSVKTRARGSARRCSLARGGAELSLARRVHHVGEVLVEAGTRPLHSRLLYPHLWR